MDYRLSQLKESKNQQYRAVSPLALVSLVLGIASLLAVLAPLLCILSVLSILTGVLSLRAIFIDPAGLMGRRAALAGILLGVFSVSATSTWAISRDRTIKFRGQKVASAWLEMVRQGHLQEAHQLAMVASRREAIDVPLETFYDNNAKSQQDLDEYFAKSPLHELRHWGQKGELFFEKTLEHQFGGNRDYVDFLFLFRYKQDGNTATIPLRIILERTIEPETNRGLWHVVRVRKPDPNG